MEYGKMIKEARIEQGMTQDDLARAAGVTKRAVAYWEGGKRKISLECADRVFKALHTSIQIGEKGDKIAT